MNYHAHRSPRSLTTTTDHLRDYPDHWELMRWYKCWRKVPYESEIVAAISAETREDDEYGHYLCPVSKEHWHVGRGGNLANPRKLVQRAKRVYRKAVRDEIWREYEEKARVVREQEETARG